ncbi:WbqC family protein [Acetomicrobium sp.]|uniref:WbqC family protein n=1 Tax=Acetomicrobium sp. TaxID=1872099 RepID=UPI002B25EBC5|nr:WbqC family protein [Acetomicrobium sp.]
MIVGIHQPNFLPWLGYFYKIAQCDVFVLLDNVQYTKNSFINRNRIKTPRGADWLTVPVIIKGRFGQLIRDVEVNGTVDWRKKHLRTLEINYRKAKYFEPIFEGLMAIYLANDWENLCELNIRLLNWTLSILGLKKQLVLASSLHVDGESTQLLIDIIKKLGGHEYISGFGGAHYQEEELFEKAGIMLTYYDFKHPVYPQLWTGFIHNLSIIDLLFNCGSESLGVLLENKGGH